jgi:DNA polymerase-3 subunit epsilon
MREVVLDTETTGLDPSAGHRIVEVGAVELVNHIPSGRRFQRYLDPERDMPEGAERVHGLSSDFLATQKRFADEVDAILEFIGDAKLVMHNAPFDLGFLNAELERIERPAIPAERTVDTLAIARRKYPGAPASLDALCKRFGIDRSAREKHGALLDAELLTDVYLELTGGRQPALGLQQAAPAATAAAPSAGPARDRTPRTHAPTEAEADAHAAFVATLKDPIWNG